MTVRSFAASCCCLALSCNQPAAPKPTAAAAVPSLSVSAALSPPPLLPELINTSATDVPGLHVVTGSIRHVGLWGFSDLAVDLSAAKLRIVSAKRGAPLFKLLPAGALAVVNGGYFEADFRPSTWLKHDGVELAGKADTSKGGLLALGSGGVYLGDLNGLGFDPVLAIQSPTRGFGRVQRDTGEVQRPRPRACQAYAPSRRRRAARDLRRAEAVKEAESTGTAAGAPNA